MQHQVFNCGDVGLFSDVTMYLLILILLLDKKALFENISAS